MEHTEFNQWINDNNIRTDHPYSKGWWDFMDLVRLIAHHLGSDTQCVVGELHFTTPPPQTPMTLPVVRMEFGHVTATIAWFLPYGGFAPEYLVSFESKNINNSSQTSHRTFTASPNKLQWVLERLSLNPANKPLIPVFTMTRDTYVFATESEMDLYGALKCLLNE